MAMRKLLPLFLVLLVLGTALPVLAQAVPTIIVQNEGKAEPLGLVELNYDVRISGYFAETSATMTFANPLPRNAEGELYFPLPPGATVCGYSLDIQGKLVEGVSVEKHRARLIFETEKNRRVDPGLVEWTSRDHFHTRVFPIPGGGQRVVRVQYVSELNVGESDGFVAETNLENVRLAGDLIVALPDVEKQNVQIEKTDHGQVYFVIHDPLPAPPAARPPFRPKRVALYWDASGSRAGVDHEREISLLRTLLKEWTDPAGRPIEVDLVLLRNTLSPSRPFRLSGQGIDRLTNALKRIGYDGGTQLGALQPLPGGAADCSIYVGDGISTFGKSDPPPLAAPLFVFSADAASDWHVLERLADDNGGQCFDLTRISDEKVVAAIAQPGYRLCSAQATAGRCAQLLSSKSDAVAGHSIVVGRLESPQATVTFRYDSDRAVDVEHTYAIDEAAATSGSLLRRLWAQRKLNELLDEQRPKQQAIAALGKQFGIVTPYTSLMVLETVEQYLTYGIEPPDSSPGLRREYLRLAGNGAAPRQAAQRSEDSKMDKAKMDEVVRLWLQRLKWWSGDTRRSAPVAGVDPGRPAPRPVAPSGLGAFGFGAPLGGGPWPANPQPLQDAITGTTAGSRFGNTGGMAGGMGGAGMGGMGSGTGFGGMGGGLGGGAMGRISGSGLAGNFGAAALPQANPVPQADDGGQFSARDFRHRPAAVVALAPHEPAASYLNELHAAAERWTFATYMRMRPRYAQSPDFFLDCADFFFDREQPELAIQVLSNLAEFAADDVPLRREMGHRLARAGAYDLAVEVFDDILVRQPDEPQSYRDLALLLAQRADEARAAINPSGSLRRQPPGMSHAGLKGRGKAEVAADYARAVELLTEIVVRRWDGRFAEIELPVLMELDRILARASAFGVSHKALDPRLCRLLDVDLRIVVTWSAEDAGIKLVVTEPSGEKASAERGATAIGGIVSRMSALYGPEEYFVRRAMRGDYVIQAALADRAGPPRAVTVHADIFTNYGRMKEQRRSLTVRLDEKAATATLGRVKF
jgi:Ca-activated chloride channel homolog